MLARISESAAEHLQVNEERSPVGNWNGSVKNTILGQGMRMRVVSSTVWKNVVKTFSLIIFALFDAMNDCNER